MNRLVVLMALALAVPALVSLLDCYNRRPEEFEGGPTTAVRGSGGWWWD